MKWLQKVQDMLSDYQSGRGSSSSTPASSSSAKSRPKAKAKPPKWKSPKTSKISKAQPSPSSHHQSSQSSQVELNVARSQAETIILNAKAEAKNIIVQAKEQAYKITSESDRQAQKMRDEIDRIKEKLYRQEAEYDRRKGAQEERAKQLAREKKRLEDKEAEIHQIKKDQLAKLERLAGLTKDEAKKLILEAVEKKIKSEKGRLIKEAEYLAKETADNKAKEILVDAMRHGATDYVAEYTISVVKLQNEEMKGRIIGKEGRNIRAFEKATGVDLELDEAPDSIRLSCFDPIRREIARVALETLMSDGRIQPTRIEEVVKKTRQDLDRVMLKAGEQLCHQVKVYHLPQEVVRMLGRFKYRYSYGQNMINHAIEVTNIGVALANEVHANTNVVRLGCLLHDIGKVIPDEEGSHVQLGVSFLKKHRIPEPVIRTVAEHHEDHPFSSTESVLVYIADAISGARPGARYENYADYVKRMTDLEEVANSFAGVKKAYAIQAGREVRVLVDPQKMDDDAARAVALDVKDKIEKELTFPGQVKVTVIRELRTSQVAN